MSATPPVGGLNALVAQWIERQPSKLSVVGSIPAEGTLS